MTRETCHKCCSKHLVGHDVKMNRFTCFDCLLEERRRLICLVKEKLHLEQERNKTLTFAGLTAWFLLTYTTKSFAVKSEREV